MRHWYTNFYLGLFYYWIFNSQKVLNLLIFFELMNIFKFHGHFLNSWIFFWISWYFFIFINVLPIPKWMQLKIQKKQIWWYFQITNLMICLKNYYCFYKKLLLFHIHIHFLKNYYMQQKNYLWRTSGWCAIAIYKKILLMAHLCVVRHCYVKKDY